MERRMSFHVSRDISMRFVPTVSGAMEVAVVLDEVCFAISIAAFERPDAIPRMVVDSSFIPDARCAVD
jgi:hypothetical protein